MIDFKKTYIIAEAGVNHNGSLDRAMEMVDAAAEAGADAVKFQSFRTGKIVSPDAPKAEYQKKTTNPGETQYEMLRKLELDISSHRALIRRCQERKIMFLSTPFDFESLQMLMEEFNLPIIKISSGDITNGPLLLNAAKWKRPIILSTGMSSIADIETALGILAFGYTGARRKPSIEAFRESYCSERGLQALVRMVTLLHCTTEYPAPFDEVNLHAMGVMRSAFGLPVGYSDHTAGIAVTLAAVALGAVIIEKHFSMDKNLPGPDHRASLEPGELKTMIESARAIEKSLGSQRKAPTVSELKNKHAAQKSIVAAVAIREGERFTEKNVTVKRPGSGLSPVFYWDIMGRRADRNYFPDEAIAL
jgi:N-acetylneuraminate synthase